ncbi:twin-arginine translocation signal domain-containing protein, partial [Gordonia amicalis]
MERRDFLAVLAAGTVGALTASTVTGCASPVPAAEITPSGTPLTLPTSTTGPPTPALSRAGLLPPAVGTRRPLPRYLLRSPAPRGNGRQVRYDFLPLSL